MKPSRKLIATLARCTSAVVLGFSPGVGLLTNLHAADAPTGNTPPTAPAPSAANNSAKGPNSERNFYDVLEDLLSDFEYDLRNGDVRGLKDLAIRNTATSENIPTSFKNHLDLVVTERILKNNKTKIVQCLPCKAKKTTVSGDQMIITSPDSNPVELSRIAKVAGISNFMDIAFTYSPSAMLLSFYITEPDSSTVVWSRTYNSETSRASTFRRGVDYSQIENARRSSEYVPTIQYRLGLNYVFEPNISETTGCLAVVFRMMERYDNRRKEVGFEFNYIRDGSSIVSSSETTTDSETITNLYSSVINATLLFMHAWNFIGNEENFNLMRGSIFAGVGGTYTSGYLGGLVRAGYEVRLAKHWAVNLSLGYRPSSTAFVGVTESIAVSGLEYGLGIHYLF